MAFKWILGAVGWVLGGYIGGIIGFVIGSAIDGGSNLKIGTGSGTGTGGGWTGGGSGGGYSGGGYTGGRRPYTQAEQRNSFLISLLVLSTAVMKADGKTLKSELNYIKDFVRQNFGEDAIQDALTVIKKLLQSNIDIYQACSQIKQYMQISQRLQLFHYLLGIAQADGQVSPEESSMLFTIGGYLGLSEKDIRSIMGMFEPEKDPYKILEIDSSATDEEVRKAYRRMAVKYHPDKVESLGADVKKAAEEKFKSVQSAYEQIKKERGMK
ncbi:MAG: TerB family tellurite resistance protein [Bacteroidales bacterium]|nr:TerB family tellurite resistance protein [Bacteroidales bacterium]